MPRKARRRPAGGDTRAQASMRPGLLCPGKRSPLAHRGPAQPGFNEAGAVMPRKGDVTEGYAADWTGFNEAGAVMPRKDCGHAAGASEAHQLQ